MTLIKKAQKLCLEAKDLNDSCLNNGVQYLYDAIEHEQFADIMKGIEDLEKSINYVNRVGGI